MKIRGDLGDHLVGTDADGSGEPFLGQDCRLDLPGQVRGPVIGAGEAQVKIGLIDAGSLHHRGILVQDGHDPRRDLAILPVRAPHEYRGGPAPAPGGFGQPPGRGNGHGRMDAVGPGRVIGGGHHPPAQAAGGVGPHHQRPPLQFRVVPFFNGREKGVHIQMTDDAHAASRITDSARA